MIRRAAGLGRAPTRPDPDRYAQRYAHCDVLVVGAGPAGLAAALAAADSGARVILCDEQRRVRRQPAAATTPRASTAEPAHDWVQHARSRSLAATPAGHACCTRTTAFGYFPHNLIGLNERLTDHLAAPPRSQPRERLWQVRARAVVLADRRHRAAAGVSGQRSARHHAGGRRAHAI